eukprot:1850221-Rhodomonas_salina.2
MRSVGDAVRGAAAASSCICEVPSLRIQTDAAHRSAGLLRSVEHDVVRDRCATLSAYARLAHARH